MRKGEEEEEVEVEQVNHLSVAFSMFSHLSSLQDDLNHLVK